MSYPRAIEQTKPLIVGKKYWIECIAVFVKSDNSPYKKEKWWLPIYGFIHVDEADAGTPPNLLGVDHLHYDMRFLIERELKILGFTESNSGVAIIRSKQELEKQWKLKECLRQWQPWSWELAANPGRRRFEKKYKECNNGCKVCPHQNFDLKTVEPTTIRGEAVKICPGHNLAWSVETGELVPRTLAVGMHERL